MEGREPTTVGTGAEVEETLGIGKEDALPCQLSSQRMSTLDGVGRIKTSAAPAPKNSIQMSKQQPALHTPRPSLDLSRATSGYSASSFFDEKNVPAKNITSDDDEAEDDDEVLLKTPFREPGFHSRCGKTLGVGLGQGGLRGGNGWGELSQDFFSGAGTNGSNVGFGCGTPLDPKPNQNQTKTFGTTKQGTSTGTLFGPASSQVTGKFHPASLPPGIPSNTFDQAKKNTSGHFDTSTSNPSSGALFSHSGRISFFDAHTAMPSFSGTTFSSSFGAVPTFGTGSTLFGTPATTPYAPANSNSSNGDGALGSPMSIGSNTSTSIGASINAVQNNAFTASGAGMNPGIGFGFQSSGQSRGTEADLQQVFAEARSAAPARRVLKPKGMLGWRRK
ncbi:uncharacterized protein EI97DRAFT_430208 [Westerdykella ornata]|uniref:Uncharacterized protein n=1 Tax=Westerdykella ornata TaxID=318751 RepID=A0A6A6JV55_WESOR|nr:uncharacterized protein EI97DRAFT_430208 [Westerdykella ornata]KAF2280500.1 hypothetical protein EI97DRAFT_430208 [Westerdykella ornata]